jgi:hypothetical protein
MSEAADLRLYSFLLTSKSNPFSLEDVQYRFALADTDEKLEKMLSVYIQCFFADSRPTWFQRSLN